MQVTEEESSESVHNMVIALASEQLTYKLLEALSEDASDLAALKEEIIAQCSMNSSIHAAKANLLYLLSVAKGKPAGAFRSQFSAKLGLSNQICLCQCLSHSIIQNYVKSLYVADTCAHDVGESSSLNCDSDRAHLESTGSPDGASSMATEKEDTKFGKAYVLLSSCSSIDVLVSTSSICMQAHDLVCCIPVGRG